jgi:hypothetical protein
LFYFTQLYETILILNFFLISTKIIFQSSSASNPGESNPDLPCGVGKMRLAPAVCGDYSIAKRLTMLLFACLRAAGTMKLYVEVPRFDVKTRDFYATLGFMPQVTPPPLVPGASPGAGPAAPSTGEPDTANLCPQDELIVMVRSF